MRTALVTVCLLAVALFAAGSTQALEIRVAPSTLVLSSPGGKLTVHTDVPIGLVEEISLAVDGVGLGISTFADSLGNVVAQCSKEAAKQAIGDFEGNTTTATVTLTVNGQSQSEEITVKK